MVNYAKQYGWTVSESQVIRDTSYQYGCYVELEVTSLVDSSYHTVLFMYKTILTGDGIYTNIYQLPPGSEYNDRFEYDYYIMKGEDSSFKDLFEYYRGC